LELTSSSNVKTDQNPNTSDQSNDNESKKTDLSTDQVQSHKKKKRGPDIPCNSVASITYKMEQQQSHSKNEVNSPPNKNPDKSDSKTIKPFNYSDYDYSTFSSNNPTNAGKSSFDPQNRPKRNNNKSRV